MLRIAGWGLLHHVLFTAVAIGDAGTGGGATLHLFPQDKGGESPACLDGSPFGAYFQPSSAKSTRWTMYIEGGGWCYDENECYSRSNSTLGSSKNWPDAVGCACMNAKEDGSIDQDCNCLHLKYGDGASFSGFRPEPWPVPNKPGAQLYFRGIKNFDAAIDFAFANGLGDATEFLLTGQSAGGLSTFLHIDRVAARLAEQAPKCTHVRAAPDVGYFLDHGDVQHDSHTYTAQMKYVYHMQNLSFGPDGGLLPACRVAFSEDPHLCFMSPHMQQFIRTPFFVLNSKYDSWQLGMELHSKALAPALQYGKDFMDQFQPVRAKPENGAAITSCVCHECDWYRIELDGTKIIALYAAWYVGKTSGSASIHIDGRGPNGDGTFEKDLCEHLEDVEQPGPIIQV